ncbi:MAG TPA: DUF4397 domain-containing protein [Puia sp.]|jgi:hypothetical protein|nr:DUF4397 domain-containing protein [Puia sp.]
MRNNRQQFFWGSIILLVLLGGAGCSKTGSSLTVTAVTYVSVINEAPYSGAVDIYLNGTLVSPSGGIAPGQYSTQYGSVKPGVYTVDFKKTGTDSVLYEIPASPFDTTNFYTLILYNSARGSSAVQAVKIADNFSSVTNTSAYYRFFNLSPDVPSANLYLNGSIAQLQRAPADYANNLTYDEFQAVSPGVYTLQVKSPTTDSVLAAHGSIALTAGSVYTIFLSGTDTSVNNLSINVLQASF